MDRAGAQWRPHGGKDDIEMKEWDLQSLHKFMSIVEQEQNQEEAVPKSGLGVSIRYVLKVKHTILMAFRFTTPLSIGKWKLTHMKPESF
jgi:hypothetical protein